MTKRPGRAAGPGTKDPRGPDAVPAARDGADRASGPSRTTAVAGDDTGDAAGRFGRRDWSATPLGEPRDWPAGLKAAARLISDARQPALVCWGPELACLHNDAFAAAMDADGRPGALGAPAPLAWPELWDRLGRDFARVLAGGPASWHEDVPVEVRRAGRRETTWWTCGLSPVHDEGAPGGVGGVLALCTDVTRMVRELGDARRRAADSEDRLALALEAIDAGVFDLDLASGEHRWDARMRQLLGVLPDVEPGLDAWLACLHPDDRDRAREALDEALRDPEHDGRWHLQYRVRKLGGGWRWLEASGKVGFEGVGSAREPMRLTGVAFDVTARTEAAAALAGSTQRLRESEERLRLAMASSAMGYWDTDIEARVTVLSDGAQRILDLQGKELATADEVVARIHPHDRDRVESAFARAIDPAGSGVLRQEFRIVRKDGSVRWLEASARTHFALVGGWQRAVRSIGVLRDVTDQREAELARERLVKEVEAQRRRLDVVLNNASVAIFLMDARQHCAYMNPAAEKLTGYTLAETQGRPLHDVVHHTRPDGSPFPLEECPIDRAFPEKHQEQGEEVFVHRDGSFYPVAFTASPIRDEQSRTVGTIIEVRDIRREKETLEALRETDRRKDEYLAMLAHELRNPLAPLTNAHRVLAKCATLGERERAMLAMAQRQAAQLKRLVDDLLEVSRVSRGKIALQLGQVLVAEAVRQAVASVEHECTRRGHALALELGDPALAVRADPARLAQMLENLLGNACKYTPDGGRIAVTVTDLGDDVEIGVRDNGIGIEPDKIPQLFELFQQIDAPLDRAAGGLGVGLAMVRHLAQLHGGSVRADSAGRGHGATFTLRLPRGGPPV